MNLSTIYYNQTTGIITTDTGAFLALGWSGNGAGKNNPGMEDVHNVGPLPKGKYAVGLWQDEPHLGPMVAPLKQIEGETYGRSGFFFHGPDKDPKEYGQESHGCIVVPHVERQTIKELDPFWLIVE